MVRIRKRLLPLLLACALPTLAGSKVYVFYPSLLRPNAIQSALTEKCPGLEVTVFGRLMDFTTMMKQTPPDAVVAPGVVLDQFAGYKQVLHGARKGAVTESMVLVSVDKPVDLGSIASLNVGIVGILERAKLGSFVGEILKGQPKLKNVTKLEDLLPLLTFQNADAILVSEDFVDELKGKSQANLVVTKVPGGKVELVAVAAKDDGVAKTVESAFKGLGAKEKSMLGVDSWNK